MPKFKTYTVLSQRQRRHSNAIFEVTIALGFSWLFIYKICQFPPQKYIILYFSGGTIYVAYDFFLKHIKKNQPWAPPFIVHGWCKWSQNLICYLGNLYGLGKVTLATKFSVLKFIGYQRQIFDVKRLTFAQRSQGTAIPLAELSRESIETKPIQSAQNI